MLFGSSRIAIVFALGTAGCTLTQSLDDLRGSNDAGRDVSAGGTIATGGTWPGSGGQAPDAATGGTTNGGGSSGAGTGGVAGTPSSGGGGTVGCPNGQKQCGSDCVSVNDPDYGCRSPSCNTCVLPHATATCGVAGCVIQSCNANWGDCDSVPGNGCEEDLMNSLAHCGGCGSSCAFPNASTSCQNGSCSWSCSSPYSNCDGNLSNGCETDLNAGCQCYLQCPGCMTCCANATVCLQCQCAA